MSEQQERLNAIWVRTVEKLKEVVREFEVTEDELHAAGDYLNRLGQSGMCRSLLDVALAMTAADVSAMGISNVECATRLRKARARQAPHVPSKRMIYFCRFKRDRPPMGRRRNCISAAPAALNRHPCRPYRPCHSSHQLHLVGAFLPFSRAPSAADTAATTPLRGNHWLKR